MEISTMNRLFYFALGVFATSTIGLIILLLYALSKIWGRVTSDAKR